MKNIKREFQSLDKRDYGILFFIMFVFAFAIGTFIISIN
jgi:hypothetical protein